MRLRVVCGDGGFIGGAIYRRLAADGDGRSASIAQAPTAAPTSRDAAATVAALGGADAVITPHALVSERGVDDFARINVRGTRNVLDAAASRTGAR